MFRIAIKDDRGQSTRLCRFALARVVWRAWTARGGDAAGAGPGARSGAARGALLAAVNPASALALGVVVFFGVVLWSVWSWGPLAIGLLLFTPVMSSTLLLLMSTLVRWAGVWRRGVGRLIGALVRTGLCPACCYRVEGLEPGADGCVVCPECGGAWSVVDPGPQQTVVVRAGAGTGFAVGEGAAAERDARASRLARQAGTSARRAAETRVYPVQPS